MTLNEAYYQLNRKITRIVWPANMYIQVTDYGPNPRFINQDGERVIEIDLIDAVANDWKIYKEPKQDQYSEAGVTLNGEKLYRKMKE